MEIETDSYDIELRGQVVGYRTCVICGKTFAKDMQHPKRQKCPDCVLKDVRCSSDEKKPASFRELKRCEKIESEKRRERIRLRDAAYARWERENGVKPTYRVDGCNIIETRGHVCMGFCSASIVQHI